MPIDRLDFDNISEADLIELLTIKVPEGLNRVQAGSLW